MINNRFVESLYEEINSDLKDNDLFSANARIDALSEDELNAFIAYVVEAEQEENVLDKLLFYKNESLSMKQIVHIYFEINLIAQGFIDPSVFNKLNHRSLCASGDTGIKTKNI